MAMTQTDSVLAEKFWNAEGNALMAKRAALIVTGIVLLAIAAKVRVPMWPVPITLQTMLVMTIGAAYGPRLGLATIIGYLLVGAIGFDIFTSSSAEANGIAYMMGTTGGYLVGFVLATLALGYAARRGWDRTVWQMALALLAGTVLIYIPGVLWLGNVVGWDKPVLEWGLYPFLAGDAVKLAIAALAIPAVWKLVGKART